MGADLNLRFWTQRKSPEETEETNSYCWNRIKMHEACIKYP